MRGFIVYLQSNFAMLFNVLLVTCNLIVTVILMSAPFSRNFCYVFTITYEAVSKEDTCYTKSRDDIPVHCCKFIKQIYLIML
jgi:hypothetical protein